MGRLQKKKTSSKKKKKPSVNAVASSRPDGERTGKKVALISDSSKEVKKRQVLSTPKTSSVTRVVPVKPKNFLDNTIQFLREVKVELKKVTWPSRKQTVGSTVVVIILVLIVSLFLGVVDIGLSNLVRVVLQ
jgi:preprotein translocase subunit SecE